MSRIFTVGQEVVAPSIGDHAIVKDVTRSPYGGLQYELEVDERFPFPLAPVVRRKTWVHETHIGTKKGTSKHVIPEAQHESESDHQAEERQDAA